MPIKKIVFSLLSLVLLCTIFVLPVRAGDFEQSYIRLERHKISTQTGALVCATPETPGTENKVIISFPNNFNVNATAANWTVDIDNLPQGAVAWPGISTASGISSNSVTFPSSDLTEGTLYCFNFNGTNTLTNPTTTGFTNLQLATQTSTSTTIDSASIGLTVVQNDTLTVSARTGLNGTELQNELTSNHGIVVFQNEEIEYQITYGNRSVLPINIIVEASWNKGQFEDESARIHDIADYQLNSASWGYNETVPIIDMAARKITWYITNFPAQTENQIVTFKLRTRSDYKGDKKINFSTSSRIIEDTVASSYSSIYHEYRYGLSLSSPEPSIATPAPTSIPLPAPTPTPRIGFQSVDITEVSNTGFIAKILLSKPGRLAISYGTNPKNLNNILRVPQMLVNQLVELKDLDPNSNYYFRIRATDESGVSSDSDIFYVKTSSKSLEQTAFIENLVISSSSNILYGGGTDMRNVVTLAKNSLVEFNFKLINLDTKQIQVYIQPKNLSLSRVLGLISTVSANEVGSQSLLNELTLGNFYGRLRVPEDLGQFDVVARVSDYAGNIFETILFPIKSVKPITILSKVDNKPIEGARVYLYSFNEREKIYSMLSAQVLHLTNPIHTDSRGEISLNLPQGKYRVEVNAIGFKDQIVDFEISSEGSTGYPEILLEKDPEIFFNTLNYYTRSAKDMLDYTKEILLNITSSTRLFDLFSLGILATLVLATWIAFLVKLRISLFHLPHMLVHKTLAAINRGVHKHTISGYVYNLEQDSPIHNFEIILQNKNGVVLEEHKIEQKEGDFTIDKLPPGTYNLEIIKEHFPAKQLKIELFSDKELKIDLGEIQVPTLFKRLELTLLELTGISFEALMIVSIIIELLFIYSFGIWKVMPFLILSIINLAIFVQFIRTSKL